LRQVALPAIFFFIIMARLNLTQDYRVESTLALPWERRSALEQQFHGVRLCAYTYITPITQTFSWSAFDNVMLNCTSWFGNHGSCQYLVLPQDFAIARAW
jgi:hypothetical protein